MNRTLFPQYKKAFSTYYLKENEEDHKLSEITRIHFLELGKINVKEKPISEMTPHERLGVYFKYAADESKSEVIDLTKPILEEISAQQELRELEEASKRYRYDVNTARSVGHREGKEEGIEIGRTEGERIKLIQLVCKKILKGKSVAIIAEELEEEIEIVEKICSVAEQYAPEYDMEKIYETLKGIE